MTVFFHHRCWRNMPVRSWRGGGQDYTQQELLLLSGDSLDIHQSTARCFVETLKPQPSQTRSSRPVLTAQIGLFLKLQLPIWINSLTLYVSFWKDVCTDILLKTFISYNNKPNCRTQARPYTDRPGAYWPKGPKQIKEATLASWKSADSPADHH